MRSINQKVGTLGRHIFIWLILSMALVSCVSFQKLTEFSGFHEVVDNDLPLNLLWSYESAKPMRVPPRANQETLVLLQTDGVFVALDLETGAVKWKYDTLSKTSWPVSDMPYDMTDEILVTVLGHDHLAVIDVLNGRELWRAKLNVSSSNMMDVFLIEDVVIISTWSKKPGAAGYVAGYHLPTGELIMEQSYHSRLFHFSFHCPDYNQNSSKYTVCVALGDYLEVLDFDPKLQEDELRRLDLRHAESGFWSIDRPIFKHGLTFLNLSPQPANQVTDVFQDESFALFDQCRTKNGPPPVTKFGDMILVATGCGELYTLDINSVREQPEWIFPTSDLVRSSFVTLDGDVGYILSNQAEIIGVDLSTGAIAGRFTTEPASLNKGKYLHSLAGHDPYLYASLNGHQIFVFEKK